MSESESIERFFTYARERYNILQRRRIDESGDPQIMVAGPPWTEDPILQQYRFCNIFREDDRTTRWIRSHITEGGYGDRLVGAMIIARWFNRIETLKVLLPPRECEPPYWRRNLLYNWDPGLLYDWAARMKSRLGGISPLVTGAYMVKTPAGMRKLDGLLWCMEQVLPDARQLHERFTGPISLRSATEMLSSYPYLGPFMAYEIVTDLRHSILSDAPDIMTWANPGPGCTRGVSRIFCGDRGVLNRHSRDDYEYIQVCMQQLLVVSQDGRHWPSDWPAWEMREVEHTLCEFDKYERARLGQGTPKQRYSGGAS